MYSIINSLIGYTGDWTTSLQSTYVYICGSLIVLMVAVVIDIIYRIFRNFWR